VDIQVDLLEVRMWPQGELEEEGQRRPLVAQEEVQMALFSLVAMELLLHPMEAQQEDGAQEEVAGMEVADPLAIAPMLGEGEGVVLSVVSFHQFKQAMDRIQPLAVPQQMRVVNQVLTGSHLTAAQGKMDMWSLLGFNNQYFFSELKRYGSSCPSIHAKTSYKYN
jgi:hypothetical protein